MRYRFCSRLVGGVALALAGGVALPESALAQSLFESLFGSSKPKLDAPGRQTPQRLAPNGAFDGGNIYGAGYAPRPRSPDGDDGNFSRRAEQRGSHQTVCVRLCDGYYWPISNAAPRSRFYRDANACSSSCGSEAKLFHYPTNGGQINDAVDLGGLAYTRLPNAFKYRKTLVQGCTCKPEPWSDAAMDRHRAYALSEQSGQNAKGGVPQVAVVPVPPPSGPEADVLATAATEDASSKTLPAVSKAGPDLETVLQVRAQTKSPRSEKSGVQTAQHVSRREPQAKKVAAQTRKAHSTMAEGGGFFGLGQSSSKMVWPGDAPQRVR